MTSLASSVDFAEGRDGHDPKPKLDHPLDIRALLVFLAVIALGPVPRRRVSSPRTRRPSSPTQIRQC